MKYLYQELKDKGLNPIRLPLNLAHSLPYSAKLDQVCGSENVTFRPVKVNNN